MLENFLGRYFQYLPKILNVSFLVVGTGSLVARGKFAEKGEGTNYKLEHKIRLWEDRGKSAEVISE